MNKEYTRVKAEFLIPKGSNIKTVIGSLWELYDVDRISDEIEDDPVLFIIEERERVKEPEPEETVEVGGVKPKDTIISKVL